MTTTTTLPRYTREYVNLSDYFEALALTEAEREAVEAALGRWYSWGDAAATLAGVPIVLLETHYVLSLANDTDRANVAVALLDGVNFVNLEG